MQVTGYKKFDKIRKIIYREDIQNRNFDILDLGGLCDTFKILEKIFPKSQIYTLNSSEEDMAGCKNKIIGDAENLAKSLKSKKFDIIFLTDVIEHLMFPDKCLNGCYEHLKKGGLLFLTTPNLACWYNRMFILMGFSPPNYHPSTEYRVGNPFIGRFPGGHKSVFTAKGLKELIRIHKFKILYFQGYEYKDLTVAAGRHGILREAVNKIMPTGLREGILIVAKRL
jgi:SAM-dependent methyltransferase